MDNQSLSEHSIAAADLLSAMANPKRLMILCTLVDTEVPVGVLASRLVSASPLSRSIFQNCVPATGKDKTGCADHLLFQQFRIRQKNPRLA